MFSRAHAVSSSAVGAAPGGPGHEGDRPLSGLGVLRRDHRDRVDPGMATQQDLHLGGEHTHALDLDEVLVAAEVVQASVLVDAAVVAGVQPPVAQLPRGRIGPVPVARHHRGAAQHDLPLRPDGEGLTGLEGDHGDVGPGHGQAAEDRLRAQVTVFVGQAVGGGVEGVRLGEPVGRLPQHRPGAHRVAPAGPDLRVELAHERHRGGVGERRQVVGPQVGVVEQLEVVLDGAGHDADPVPVDRRQRPCRVPPGEQNDGSAGHQGQ